MLAKLRQSVFPGTRALRLGSGLTLFAFVASHLANHAAGLISLEDAEALRLLFVAFWRSLPVSVLLYGALVLHIGLALEGIYGRRTLRMPWPETLRLLLGLAIPFLLTVHLAGTRLAHELFGIEDNYRRIAAAIWAKDGGLQQLALIAAAWAHGCMGIHFAVRHRPGYRQAFSLVFALALLVPILAFLGFVSMAREIEQEIATIPSTPLTADQAALHASLIGAMLAGFASLIAATFVAREIRRWRERSRGMLTLAYPGRNVSVPIGWSVLEASRVHGIPHQSMCGGRARCSTCRVRVFDTRGHCPPAALNERSTLERIHAPRDVRLACQLRPAGDIGVVPLLSTPNPGRQVADVLELAVEREVVILFTDLRRWTGLSEKQLPYDLIYVLNQYFTAIGDAVRAAGGVPNQFIGDSVMAIFGLESDLADASRRALHAARLIAANMEALNERLQRELAHTLGYGIGLHAGPAVIGEVGYRDTRTLSAVGDTVNTASRLQELTKRYNVPLVLSERVAIAASLDTSAFEAHELEIRGRTETLKVYTVGSPGADLQLPG